MARMLCRKCGQVYDTAMNPTSFGFGTSTHGYHCSYHPGIPEKTGHSLGARDGYVDVWQFSCCGRELIGAVINGHDVPPSTVPGCQIGAHEPDPEWEKQLASMKIWSNTNAFPVFISFNHNDEALARKAYEYLVSHKFKVFFSAATLSENMNTDFVSAIHDAINEAKNLVVVCSEAVNCNSGWVRSEINMFLNELRSGRKDGNIVVLAGDKVHESDLPIALRQWQIIRFGDDGLRKMLLYLGSRN